MFRRRGGTEPPGSWSPGRFDGASEADAARDQVWWCGLGDHRLPRHGLLSCPRVHEAASNEPPRLVKAVSRPRAGGSTQDTCPGSATPSMFRLTTIGSCLGYIKRPGSRFLVADLSFPESTVDRV